VNQTFRPLGLVDPDRHHQQQYQRHAGLKEREPWERFPRIRIMALNSFTHRALNEA
jgi:hypothetical protein